MTSARGAGPIPGFLLILAALTALAPLATDAYLPAIPTIANELGRSVHDVELSISLFLGGFALGQVIGGPFSDHFGRRIGIFTGLSLFCVGTAAILFTSSLEWLWGARVLQAIGGGLTVVNTPAIVRDFYSGRESAATMSRMGIILMIAPLSAPLIGSVILQFSSWQMIFLFLLCYGVLLGWVIHRRLPESRQVQLDRPNALKRYWAVLSHRYALGYLASACCAYGSLFAFITGSPSVYMGYFGLSESVYPFVFGANVVTLIAMSRLNIRLLRKHMPLRLLSVAQVLQLGVGLIFLAYIYFSSAPALVAVVLLIMLFMGFHGLLTANTMAGITEFFPTNAATATALLGACGFATGALSGTLVGIYGDGTAWPMAVIMAACSVLAPVARSLLQLGSAPAAATNS